MKEPTFKETATNIVSDIYIKKKILGSSTGRYSVMK